MARTIEEILAAKGNRGFTPQEVAEIRAIREAAAQQPTSEPEATKPEATEEPQEEVANEPEAVETEEVTESAEITDEPSEKEIDAKPEHDWKKRHDDLRSFNNKLQEEIKQLKEQLENATPTDLGYNEEELVAFKEQYPDFAHILEQALAKQKHEFDKLLKEQKKEELEKLTERQQAEAKIAEKHPDWVSIRDSEQFKTWLKQQPRGLQAQASSTNPDDAIEVLDFYKKFTTLLKTKKVEQTKRKTEAVVVSESKNAPSLPEVVDVDGLRKKLTDAMRDGSRQHEIPALLAKLKKAQQKAAS